MAILTIDIRAARQAGTIHGLVLIGRWPINTIVIDDNAISRIHAWIAQEDGRDYIGDAQSRSGTLINGERLLERRFLADGDEIRIGPAVIHYQTGATAGGDWEPIDLTSRPLEELSQESGGTLMQCQCGAPLWFPPHYALTGRCRHCGSWISPAVVTQPIPQVKRPVKAPGPPPVPPIIPLRKFADEARREPAPVFQPADLDPHPPIDDESAEIPLLDEVAPLEMEEPVHEAPAEEEPLHEAPAYEPSAEPAEERTCGICHSAILASEATATCPSCKLVFHADCWHENRGCAAYGCDQVNILEKRAG